MDALSGQSRSSCKVEDRTLYKLFVTYEHGTLHKLLKFSDRVLWLCDMRVVTLLIPTSMALWSTVVKGFNYCTTQDDDDKQSNDRLWWKPANRNIRVDSLNDVSEPIIWGWLSHSTSRNLERIWLIPEANFRGGKDSIGGEWTFHDVLVDGS